MRHHQPSRHRLTAACVYLLLFIFSRVPLTNADTSKDADHYLVKADSALSNNRTEEAVTLYSSGIQLLPKQWSTEVIDESAEASESGEDDAIPDAKEMEIIVSLHTNYGTALSFVEGPSDKVIDAYKTACLCYRKWKKLVDEIEIDEAPKKAAIQSFFFLGMTYQDRAAATNPKEQQEEYLQHAVKAYAAATKLDPNHWSSFANMGVVLADVGVDSEGNNAVSLQMFDEGIMSYHKAIMILTGYNESGKRTSNRPTDPPENAKEVVAELQYRTGLCLVPSLFTANNSEDDYNKKLCTLPSVAKERSCMELAAYQFHTALQSNDQHEGALNALTLVTADATFGMSTDVKNVQQLFEDYASR